MFIRPKLIFEEKVKIHVLDRARAGPSLGPGRGPAWGRADPSRENQGLGIRSNMTSGDVLDGLE
mgnify:CR=1 FL=1